MTTRKWSWQRRPIGLRAWELHDDQGTPVGYYGGRAGDRWATLADGTVVTEHSPATVDVVRAVLEQAISAPAPRYRPRWYCQDRHGYDLPGTRHALECVCDSSDWPVAK